MQRTRSLVARWLLGLSTAALLASSAPALAQTVPGAPTLTGYTSAGRIVILFTPAADGGSPITGYTLHSDPAGYVDPEAGMSHAFRELTGLVDGTEYTFRAVAHNAVGTSALSAPITLAPCPAFPGEPTALTLTPGNGQLTIDASPPLDNGGCPLRGYELLINVAAVPGPGWTAVVGPVVVTSLPHVVTGLANGVSHWVLLSALNDRGAGLEAQGFETPGTLPGAPTGVTATLPGPQGWAEVSFTEPASNGGRLITQYTVTSSPPGATYVNGWTTQTLIGLAPGTTYTFTVTATNAIGTGPASAPSNSITTPAILPDAPANVSAVLSGGLQATVTITPGANGGSAITGYVVVSSPAGGVDTGIGAATSRVVTGLSPGTSYTFTARAVNGVGAGPFSAASNSVTTPNLPGAPTGVSATLSGLTQATVSFTPPADGGSPITSYIVASSPPGGVDTGTGTATTRVVTGLVPGTTYTFNVVAVNGAGNGPASASSNSVTPPSVPDAPTNVAATLSAALEATVTFTAPSPGGSAISGYIVQSSPAGSVDTGVGTATTRVVTGLAPNTSYTFTVVAQNSFGNGPASAASNSITTANVPGAPTNVVAVAGDTQATVSFLAPASNGGSPITGYVVNTSPPGGIDTGAGTSTNRVVTGLSNGVTYTFTVQAINAVGPGAASAASSGVVPSGPPPAPVSVSAVAADGQATVSFASGGDNGSPITGYVVTSSPAGGVDSQSMSTSTSHLVTGLTNGTSYTFTVKAHNARGESAASAASNAVTPNLPPSAPSNASATPGTGQSIVTFTASPANGGAGPTHYEVTSNPPGAVDAQVGTLATSRTMTGLSNGTQYVFTVRAVNSGGSSAGVTTNAVRPGLPLATITVDSLLDNGVGCTLRKAVETANAVTTHPACATPGLENTIEFAVNGTFLVGTPAIVIANRPLTLVGNDHTQTVISGQGLTRIFEASGSILVRLFSVTLRDGVASAPGNNDGGALRLLNTETLMENMVFRDNAAGNRGGAVFATGALYLGSGAFIDNDAAQGGGIYIEGSSGSALDLANVTFSGNAATGAGGAINVGAANAGQVTLQHITAAGNSASAGGGLAFGGGGSVTLNRSILSGNAGAGSPDCVASAGSITSAGFNVFSSLTGCLVTGATSSDVTGTAALGPLDLSGAHIPTFPLLASSPAINLAPTCVDGTDARAVNRPQGSGCDSGAYEARIPAAPTGVSAATSNGQATVTFTPGASPDFPATYTVVSNPAGGVDSQAGTTATTHTVTGLTLGVSYTFTVVATNAAGQATSAPSGSVTPQGVPSAPLNVTVAAGNGGFAAVSFDPPANNGGQPITGYAITSDPPGAVDEWAGNVTTSGRPISGLTIGVTYTFTVRATNALGQGPASAPSSAYVADIGPGMPGVTYTQGPGTATLTITPPAPNGGTAITSYEVTWTPPGGSMSGSGLDTTRVISGLTGGVQYIFSVRARNTRLGQANDVYVAAKDLPTAPQDVSAIASGNRSAQVSFNPPANDGGFGGAWYYVESDPPGGSDLQGGQATLVRNITGLTPGQQYVFRVRAANHYGSTLSAPSNPITAMGAPGAPTNVVVVAGVLSATVSWNAPPDNGSPILRYEVLEGFSNAVTSASGTQITITNLPVATVQYVVRAENAFGFGPYSLPSNGATPIAGTVPLAPFVAARPGNGEATVQLASPGFSPGAPVTGVTITSNPPGGVDTAAGTLALTRTITGLVNGTRYTFTAVATNVVGPSNPSSPSNAVRPGAPNATITVDSFADDGMGCTLRKALANADGLEDIHAACAPGGLNNTVVLAQDGTFTLNDILPTLQGGRPVVLQGNGPSRTRIRQAAEGAWVLDVSPPSPFVAAPSGHDLTLRGITFEDATGGVSASFAFASLLVEDCVFRNNSGWSTLGNYGKLTVTRSAFIGNSAPMPGGVIEIDSRSTGFLDISNTTFSGNSSTEKGGVMFVAPGNTAPVTLRHVTMKSNTAAISGGAVSNEGTGPVTITASILAGNTAPSGPDCSGTFATGGANVVGTLGGCTLTPGSSDLVGDPVLGALEATAVLPYFMPNAGSPAIDRATSCVVAIDQRGTARPQGAGCDSGAVEFIPAATVPGAPANVAATAGNGQATVSFAPPASNGGAAITSYTVTSSPGGITVSGAGSPITVTGLTNGTPYTFTVTATNPIGTGPASAASNSVTPAAPFDPNPPRMSNISTRMQVLTGNDVMIGGFVIGGSAQKTVAIVATGPSLQAFGIANPLANPKVTLVRSSDQSVIATNDDWQSAPNQQALSAAGFAPSNPLEAAILTTLAPGAYTAIVEGVGGATGVSVIGVYEVDGPTVPLANISTRGRVLTGNDVMIGGFVVSGSGPQTLAIVATGPSLANFGITSPLANPKITLVRASDQAVIATNDDWQSGANAAQLAAAGFAPSSPLEAGLHVTLPPGAYTAIVEGSGGGTGVAVIGVYRVN